MDFNIKDDLTLIRKFYDLSQEELANELNIERVRLARTETGESYPRKEFLENVYNYCFNKGLKLNIQKEMFYKDDIRDGHILLTHASKKGIVGSIDVKIGRNNSDFGQGFYCGESYDKSISFVCRSDDPSVYFIDFDPSNLKCVEFNVEEKWMLAIAYFRGRLDEYKNNKKILDIIKSIESSDYVIAPIADNRMFEIIDQFIEGYITDEQCKHCLSATNLGLQYVFLTEKAISKLKLLERCYISNSEKKYYIKKQEEYQKEGADKSKLARIQYKGQGKYIEELLK